MGRCRTPVNRLLMMRKRGLAGPGFQNVGSGVCAKSVGSYLDVNGPGYEGLIPLPPFDAVGSGWQVQGPNLVDWDVTRWVSGNYPALQFLVNQLTNGQQVNVRGEVLTADGSTTRIRIRAGDNIPNDVLLENVGTFDATVTMDVGIAQGVRLIVDSSSTNAKWTIRNLEVIPL